MRRYRRSLFAISFVVLVLGVIGAAAAAQGPSPATLAKNEIRPEPGHEAERQDPGEHGDSHAPVLGKSQLSNVASTNPGLLGFTGVTFKDHRDADDGNQTSDTPPDQGLCAGSGVVVEPVNTTFSVYSAAGQRTSGPTSLTQFYTGKHEIDRTVEPNLFGPFLTDPRCYYDPDLKRFFMIILELPFSDAGNFFNGHSFVHIAISKTSTPSTSPADWTFVKVDTTDDGSKAQDGSGQEMPSQPDCPCFGDQPLMGADKYSLVITTNEFSILGDAFNGAQVYALDKAGLLSGKVKYQAFHGAPIPLAEGPAYSLQPATSPTAASWNTANDGTEYMLSALDFNATADHRIAVWALTNTKSLTTSKPAVHLLAPAVLESEAYGQPPNAEQKKGPIPLGHEVGEPEEELSTNDDRMNQVVYATGKLFGAVNTSFRAPPTVRADHTAIAYFVVTPTSSAASVSGTIAKQGYVALDGLDNVFYPSIAVNASGKGFMTFSIAGLHYFPSAGYASIDAVNGTGPVHVAAAGAAPQDDVSGYEAFGGDGVARWGDYSAAVPAEDGSIWMATEYVPGGFGFPPYLNDWGTFVMRVAP
jgi:hypothetical protein